MASAQAVREDERSKVVVVDDDADMRAILSKWLEAADYEVVSFPDGESCLAGLENTLPDAVCLDLIMPGLSGQDTLDRIRAYHRLLPVIVVTTATAIDTVVSMVQKGAFDYVVKPVDRNKLLTSVRNAVERYRMSLRIAHLQREAAGTGYPGIVGRSASMTALFRQLDRVAAAGITVLIQGESGAGKELVASAIHRNSGRSSGPFVALNCAAIPETLQESELFGHEKGAFTGALARRIGKFEQADGGTLFLDEVAELSLPLQAKLLRALQQKGFHRVGGTSPISSDFRLVAATHQNLAKAVSEGRFRDDLYFRIAVLELDIPPLRDRGEDVLLLTETFLQELASETGGEPPRIAPETAEIMRGYSWPGNVRELHNALHRAFVLAEGDVIRPEDLPPRIRDSVREPGSAVDGLPELEVPMESGGRPAVEVGDGRVPGRLRIPPMTLEELERIAIQQALERCRWNLTEVGRQLGIGRTTLYRKLKKYELR